MAKGKLIVLEGIDGSGKSAQYRRLCARMEKDKIAYTHIVFPRYDRDSSALIRLYLGGAFGSKPGDVNAYAASAFYAVDRFASYQRKWRDYYEAGDIILADRYTTSNMVHQAVKLTDKTERENFLDWLWDFEFNKMGLPVPDKVIFLDMAPEVADKLIAARGEKTATKKDIHERDTEYLHRCHNAYLELAAKYNWDKVVCNEGNNPRNIEDIHKDVYKLVDKLLKK